MSLLPVRGEGLPPPEPQRVPSVLHLIGNTPLLQITKVTTGLSSRVQVFAKLEGFNPGGSVKDRPALRMIEEGLRTGALSPGKVILDSTSGNTGIALAMTGAVLGYPVELVMPANVSIERKKIIAAYGAKMIFSSPLEGSDGAIRLCRQILHETPERYFKPDQYFNPANPLAHYETTGPEIWHQTKGRVTHFVAGIGTGGTIMGTGRYLKERNARIRVIAVEPDDAFHGLEGLKHMASSIVPGIYHEEQLDGKIAVSTEDAYDTVYRLGREEGVLVGQSSGAALWAALKVARGLDEGVVVTLFPDFGDKYLSTNLWVGWKEFNQRQRPV
ncbi:MAG TPA: cysteine synthase [Candidatus Binatia bacterium]|jgi:cysteine synthase B|nr:cysteine synthase [Candidatus Binatia bacterium]